ncbi:pseudouridylate synthase PUS7L isoform X2 [Erinaceus europaeus]|uniref:Pseudouridylate synthase PUS7L isoform X2 n=1 Tax=Erinaceus europaeus TaxID=9365 RepID=A0ABM3XFY5_ERIEU|nr:pseudouridylate synthase PUS7L isoform X2 [Erinaceus europaeus]
MEEDTDFKTRFSSLCFITDHIGFHGTIKNSPSDFVVTEIDEQGQLVYKATDGPTYTLSRGLSEPNDFVKKAKLDVQSFSFEERSHQEVSPLMESSDADRCPHSGSEKENAVNYGTSKSKEENVDVLGTLLDERTNELLNQFACDVKKNWNSKTELTGPSPEFSVGRILDKSQRAVLHSCIRQKFPFLITVGKNSEILVRPNLECKELCHLVSEEEAFGFFRYLDAKKENSKFTFKPDTSKDHRRAVHHFVNRKFGNLVETKSFPELSSNAGDPQAVITVRFRGKAHTHRKRSLFECQERKVIYTAFTLCKENMEMFEAIGFLAVQLGVIPSDFTYAGLKDKKAITYQAMVVKKVTPERLGQLKGNHFDIVIRNLRNQLNDSENLRERILEAIENVKVKGFVNYYGPQRFGMGSKVHTDQIGLALLKNEMVKAVKLFLTPEDLDDPVNRAKKYFLQTEDAKGTLSLMPEFKVRERVLLESLHRFGVTEEGCVQAWFSLPHSMRLFYVHAYSSKIWNEAASYRLATYGPRVVEGDLVCLDEVVDAEQFTNHKVHLVTNEEESANTYAIHQVVLPVLGYNNQYPRNEVGQWYQERLRRDGLQTCRFKVPALKLNVPGCFRQVLKHPCNVSYKLMEEHDTDLSMEGSHTSEATLSLLISFDLDASCYATICLREIMKHDF